MAAGPGQDSGLWQDSAVRYNPSVIPERAWHPPFPEDLLPIFRGEGLTLLGIAAADGSPEQEARYRERLEAGATADMDYLRRHAPLKFAPSRILAGCRSVIAVGLSYHQPAPDPREAWGATPPRGRIARYAWGRDYHKVLGDRLRRVARRLERARPGERFAPFTDATALAERHYADAAGLGFTGRNGLLISSDCGSWLVIGEILTTAALPPGGPSGDPHGSCPPSCRRCLAACPTGALTAPMQLDARRCISYLTIENRGSIPEELRPLLGDWVFGCDACQEVCPHNAGRRPTTVPDFLTPRAGPTQEIERVLALRDHEDVVAAFAGSPLVRAGRRGLVRNACVVAANARAVALLPRLRELATDSDPVVAEHAAWAVSRLTKG